MKVSGVWLPFFCIILDFVGSCCIDHLLSDALVCLVSRDTVVEVARLGWGGADAYASGLICRRILPDICSCCVCRNASVTVPRCLPRPAYHLFSFKLLGLAMLKKLNTEMRVYRTKLGNVTFTLERKETVHSKIG